MVSIYRKYVDMYLAHGRSGYRVDLADRRALLELFDRGGQSEGYYKEHNGRDMVVLKEKPAFREPDQELFDHLDRTYVDAVKKEPIRGTAPVSYTHLDVYKRQLLDSAAAFLSGMLLYVYILYGGYRLSRLVEHILGGALVTFLCMVFYHLGLGHNVSSMIIGSVIPMIPGVAFTNAIRDLTDGDYIAGSVRMMDTALVVLGIALGVGMMFTAYYRITGGNLL